MILHDDGCFDPLVVFSAWNDKTNYQPVLVRFMIHPGVRESSSCSFDQKLSDIDLGEQNEFEFLRKRLPFGN